MDCFGYDRYNLTSLLTTCSSAVTMDVSSVHSETPGSEAHPSSESQQAHPSIQSPANLATHRSEASDPNEGNSTNDGGISFNFTMMNWAVLSLLEGKSHRQGECLWLLHDMTFDETFMAINPNQELDETFMDIIPNQEFEELEYAGSQIKPGVLDTLALVDVCLSSDGGRGSSCCLPTMRPRVNLDFLLDMDNPVSLPFA